MLPVLELRKKFKVAQSELEVHHKVKAEWEAKEAQLAKDFETIQELGVHQDAKMKTLEKSLADQREARSLAEDALASAEETGRESYKKSAAFTQDALALARSDQYLSALAKEWLATPGGEDHLVEITQSDFYAGMVKMQGEVYAQLLAMDAKFQPSDYGLCDRLPESYEEYLGTTTAPPLAVPDSPSLEPPLDPIPMDTAYLDSAANAAEVASMGTAHRDGVASSHLTLPKMREGNRFTRRPPDHSYKPTKGSHRRQWCSSLISFRTFCNSPRLFVLHPLYQ